jgi:potassium-transporting ATPase KdpC subunit
MWKIFYRAFLLFISLTILTGVCYPLLVTGLARFCFPSQSNGSFIRHQGKVIGSALIGQDFQTAKYFHGRPSAANYDALASGGSNLSATNRQLIKTVTERIDIVRKENGLPANFSVPSDLITASASGLDPNISPESAMLQIPRIAKARNLPIATIRYLVKKHIEYPFLRIFGVSRVNVLRVNLALDSLKNGG